MRENILDAIEEVQPKNALLKEPKTFFFIWFFYGIACILWSLYWIHSYSTPYIDWFSKTPIHQEYERIFTGIFSLIIAKKIYLKEANLFQTLALLGIVSFLFFVTSSIYYWSLWSLSDILFTLYLTINPIFIFTIITTFATYKNALQKRTYLRLLPFAY
jgi:hypothetical protein